MLLFAKTLNVIKNYFHHLQWTDYATFILLFFLLFGFIGLKIIKKRRDPESLESVYSEDTLRRAAEYRNTEEFRENTDDDTEDEE